MSDQEQETQTREQLGTFSSTARKQDDRNKNTSPQLLDKQLVPQTTLQYEGRSSESSEEEEQIDTFSRKMKEQNYGNRNTSLQSLNNELAPQTTLQYEGRSSENSEAEIGTFSSRDMNNHENSNTSLQSLDKQFFHPSTQEYEGGSSENSKDENDGNSNMSLQSLDKQIFRPSTPEYEGRSSEHSEEKAVVIVQQESRPNAEIYSEKVDVEVQQESISNTENDSLKVDAPVQQESIPKAKVDSNKAVVIVQQESRPNAEIYSEKITRSKEAAECCHPLKIVVTIEAEDRLQRSYYDTTGKRGLLCIIQNEDTKWNAGNRKDESELRKFFENTLNFSVAKYSKYSKLVLELKEHMYKNSDRYYCLLIFISEHGNEEGIYTDLGMRQNHKITNDFCNEEIKELCGVPKIFILDVCRGQKSDPTTKCKSDHSTWESRPVTPTKSSDCLIIHATTHGYVARIPTTGSVGLQGVLEVLKMNWQKDHLEEMLIDARMAVASKEVNRCRQTLEIQSTFLKRLKFR